MKKILLTLVIFAFGMVTALADNSGCPTLVGTNWNGSVTFNDGSTLPLTVNILTVTKDTSDDAYAMTGTVNGKPFNDGQCNPFMTSLNAIQNIVINNDSDINFLAQDFNDRNNPTLISGFHGKISGKSIKSGSISK